MTDGRRRWACSRFGRGLSGAAPPGAPPPQHRNALLISALLFFFGPMSSTEAKECDKPCLNGQCNPGGGNCVCEPGWVGDQCQHCGGRFRWESRGCFPRAKPAGRLKLAARSAYSVLTLNLHYSTQLMHFIWRFANLDRCSPSLSFASLYVRILLETFRLFVY